MAVVVGTLLVPAAGAVAQETGTETGDELTPGERLSGVVGVQAAEFDGEIEQNAFRIGLERAEDNATKASHIAAKLNESEARLAELSERKAELEARREDGNVTEGQYRARMARLATETETVREQLNRSNATAAELPEETLEANGVNATAIRTLQRNASDLSGREVAGIARSIAGNRSGMPERGPPSDRGGDRNASDARPGGPDGEQPKAPDAGEERPEDRPNDRDRPDDGSEGDGTVEDPRDAGERQDGEGGATTDDGGGDGDAGSDDGSDDGDDGAENAGNAGNAGSR